MLLFNVPAVSLFMGVLACLFARGKNYALNFTKEDFSVYRQKVKTMFYHAYDGYMTNAYPYDELKPLTCTGHDTWGSFSLTLIDALDTLVVLNDVEEFRRAASLVLASVSFDSDINVSVFETNIRVVGGLLAAHGFSKKAGFRVDPNWPCEGPLLRMAEDVASRLLPAFESTTGMPYGTVNLRYGVPTGETAVACTACVGTFIVEFGTLSKLTGDPVFEEVARKALESLWERKSIINLVGNHIDVETGKWTALDAGVGAGVDSYFEYLVKGSMLLQDPSLKQQFNVYKKSVEEHIKRDDWYMWVSMSKGTVTLPIFQSLEAFWPGLQTLIGESSDALKTMHNYFQIWEQYGFHPEFYNVPKSEVYKNRAGYPLRPEFVESLMYLYQATGDPLLPAMGAAVVESIEASCKTSCGYAIVENIRTHELSDRMESFFLAETLKYLYLLFDPDHFMHNSGSTGEVISTAHGECVIDAGGYVFNTEGHPIDAALLDCCTNPANKAVQDLSEDLNLQMLTEQLTRKSLPSSSSKSQDSRSATNARRQGRNHIRKRDSASEERLRLYVLSLLDEAIAIATSAASPFDKSQSSAASDVEAKAKKLIAYMTNNTTGLGDLDPDHTAMSCPHRPFGLRFSLYGEMV